MVLKSLSDVPPVTMAWWQFASWSRRIQEILGSVLAHSALDRHVHATPAAMHVTGVMLHSADNVIA